MATGQLENVRWYVDPGAKERGEPDIWHSYVSSLASVLNCVKPEIDPAWLMGVTAFAFRIYVNETLCPSAMSIFEWSAILPEAVEQAGHRCVYVSRLWGEDDLEKEKRGEAYAAIVEGVSRGVPAVAWDVADAEWGVIFGYDDDRQSYETLTCRGERSCLAYDRLGMNGIDILSVAIPGEPNQRSRDETVINSLRAAVAHAEQQEWTDRPEYQNGLAAYDLWAVIHDRGATLAAAGRASRIGSEILAFAAYYAGNWYSARCYARDYLAAVADGDENLERASRSYARVASFLKPVWDCYSAGQRPGTETFTALAETIRKAGAAEEQGIESIKEFLARAGA